MSILWRALVVLGVAAILSQPTAKAEGIPPVQVGVKQGQTPVALFGNISQNEDGTLDLPAGEPWGWVAVGPGEKPLPQLEGLQSLTIWGWARTVSLQTGSGGNRIAFNLNYNRAGFDLVHLGDG